MPTHVASRARATLLPVLLLAARALDNGLGRTPPMGWRSWNLFGAGVNQSLIEGIMDGIVSRKRRVGGVPTSLCDLGYCRVGLDDNWQSCSEGRRYRYHDDAGHPLVSSERFPSMLSMTEKAHRLGLKADWYANNCICREWKWATDAMYLNDVAALTIFGFDGIKLDGCGTQRDLDLWSRLLNATGRPVMIENCHWGWTVPTATRCPYNLFRTSGDVRASYGSVVGNLLTTVKYATRNLSKPGCWAYPDMLEVGCQHGPGGADDPGLSFTEMRSHFGAWAIVSSPLVLSHDLNNDSIMDAVWPVISNTEVIAVNQAWAGHSGSPFKASTEDVELEDYNSVVNGVVTAHEAAVASWQYYWKPLGDGKVAVLMMNHAQRAQDLTLHFADVPALECRRCRLRDLWAHRDLGIVNGSFVVRGLASHDSCFLVVAPEASDNRASELLV